MESFVKEGLRHAIRAKEVDQDQVVAWGFCGWFVAQEVLSASIDQSQSVTPGQGKKIVGHPDDSGRLFDHVQLDGLQVMEEKVDHAAASQTQEKDSFWLLLEEQSAHHGLGVGDLEFLGIAQVNTTLLATGQAELETATGTPITDHDRMARIEAVVDEFFHQWLEWSDRVFDI